MSPFVPLGDQAVLAHFPREQEALAFARSVRRAALPWVIDIVPAYVSVAVFYDLSRVPFAAAVAALERLEAQPAPAGEEERRHIIPCCYELGPDLERIAERTGLTTDEVIRRHSGTEYTVYAIGFCPGFPYLGYLPAELCGLPRLPAPRLRVEAGSIGLTGRQTGIYTEVRPGGWNLVGRTPLQLVDVGDGYFPLRAGDRVRFRRIHQAEFRDLEGERL